MVNEDGFRFGFLYESYRNTNNRLAIYGCVYSCACVHLCVLYNSYDLLFESINQVHLALLHL